MKSGWWLRLLALGLILVAVVAMLLGSRERSTAVAKPTETGMDYPY
jgi:hypothetical protein